MFNTLIGAQMYSVRTLTQTEWDLRETLKKIKEIGYNSVQLSGFSHDICPAKIGEMLKEFDLVCPSTHISFKEMEDDIDKVIADHKLWGVKYPGIGGMPAEFAKTEAGFKEFARRANEISKKLADAGMQFIYHSHAFEFVKFESGKTGMDILIDNFKEAQFEIDVYWAQAGGADPVEIIRRVAGRMDVVHYKDMVGKLSTPEDRSMTTMAPIGAGNLNWNKIMTACEETGVKYAFVEQDNAVNTPDPIGCLKLSHDNLVSFGGRF